MDFSYQTNRLLKMTILIFCPFCLISVTTCVGLCMCACAYVRVCVCVPSVICAKQKAKICVSRLHSQQRRTTRDLSEVCVWNCRLAFTPVWVGVKLHLGCLGRHIITWMRYWVTVKWPNKWENLDSIHCVFNDCFMKSPKSLIVSTKSSCYSFFICCDNTESGQL